MSPGFVLDVAVAAYIQRIDLVLVSGAYSGRPTGTVLYVEGDAGLTLTIVNHVRDEPYRPGRISLALRPGGYSWHSLEGKRLYQP